MRCNHYHFGFLLFAAVFGAPPPVVAQTQAPVANAPADPTFEAAKKVFDALPEADRRAIQDALIWTGDYKGVVDGGFGRATRTAIVAWAKRAGAPTDGTLDARARGDLAAAASKAKQAAGFVAAHDDRSGVSLSLPLKLLTKRTDVKSGSRWTSADSAITIETTRSAEKDGDLGSQFDRLKDSRGARKVTYKVARPDFFVISGETGATAFYTRMSRGDADGEAQLRGFTMTWPKGVAADDNLVIAVANSFNAFPAAAVPVAARPSPSPAAAGAPPATAAAARRPVLTATAVNLGGDVAVSAISACEGAEIGNRPAKFVGPEGNRGLGRYGVQGLGGKPAGGASGATPKDGEPVVVFYRATTGAASQLMATSGEIETAPAGARVVAALEDTAAGGAVFDRTGALVGYVGSRKAPAQVAGVTPRAAWPLIPAADAGVASTAVASGAMSMADIADRAAGAILPLVCVR